jgi:hypothetical protein
VTTLTEPQQYCLNALAAMIADQLGAIRTCIQKSYRVPAIALMYMLMDNMASVFRPDLTRDVCRRDFEDWVTRYLLPGSGLACSAADLYGARCGVLHTYSPESSRSREQKAREVLYAWGEGTEGELEQMIRVVCTEAQRPEPWPLAVHLDRLHRALEQGVRAALGTLKGDQALTERVLAAAMKLFSMMPAQDAAGLMAAIQGDGQPQQ